MLRKVLAYKNLLFILFLLNSSCFFLTDDKRAGIPFLRELFLLCVIAATVCLFVAWRFVYQSKTSLWIIFMGVALPLISATLAYLNFGQPLPYGLLEERRFFEYLVFFPTLFLLIMAKPTEEEVGNYFLYVALICATVGFMYYLGIIPTNTVTSYTVDDWTQFEDLLRPDRYRIGSGFVTISAFMLMYKMRDRVTISRLAILLYFVAYLWLVMQTRQTMLVWGAAGLWIFRKRIDSLMKMSVLGVALLVISYFIVPEFYVQQYERFHALLFEATSGPGVRDVTVATIVEAISNNNYIGMGALSLQWNGGFTRIYNSHFYLSDVGVFGVYYRFGFLALAAVMIYYGGYLWIMSQCRNKGSLLSAVQVAFVFGMMNFMLSNGLTFNGSLYGMAAAIFLYYAKLQATDTNLTRNLEQVNYDQFQYRNYKLE
ncbi:hypothetical protein [Stutzerimonas zhaodongensis]|uniref:hypothetical protein n=1 Tax=Stutzerimonas zhaodongensis TaxID=1176257 RepID=UPI001FC9441B|nr:hypothetical protein [Stutzerimonas zhaodongensis]MCQ4315319.1 hypothetical protein [Stutzerimonas zhaodongensis]